jgi:hypothetical protein
MSNKKGRIHFHCLMQLLDRLIKRRPGITRPFRPRQAASGFRSDQALSLDLASSVEVRRPFQDGGEASAFLFTE